MLLAGSGAPLGAAAGVESAGGAGALTPAAAGSPLPWNIVNDTIVAPAATAAMTPITAKSPLRDLGAGDGWDASRAAEPSVAYE
jgi:hypothetical protein